MEVPPISTSALNALTGGFNRLNRAAQELASPADLSPPTDSVELTGTTPGMSDPMISGMKDLMLAQLQVGAGALLLHAYSGDRQRLFDLLNASGSDKPAA
jgi:hypothetical protein